MYKSNAYCLAKNCLFLYLNMLIYHNITKVKKICSSIKIKGTNAFYIAFNQK